ncbi:relaxin receptor 1 [Elysia marginata]|uniref:Relaxin receptor 1 n=1 Tax=Elysia marginata TaxID=1093978 RepID=A0AAV4HK86_9GAST|nr:relaxin receptor 1 [Elysia marginata]
MSRMRLERQERVDTRLLELSMARRISRIAGTNFLCFCAISTIVSMAWCGKQISNAMYAWTMVLLIPVNSAINPLLYFYPVLSKKLVRTFKK